MGPPAGATEATGRLRLRRRLGGWIGELRANGGIYVANFLFQRVLRINAACRWSVHYTSRVVHPERISAHPTVRRSFALSPGCYIQATNGIELGEGVLIGPGAKLVSADHDLSDLRRSEPGPPLRVGARCWIGANAILLPGVQLGEGTVVGAGSVVTKSFPGGCVLAGVPARVVRGGPPAESAVRTEVDSHQPEP
jgi:acetyltransferase-like isoleucine patch superfamily enzyme